VVSKKWLRVLIPGLLFLLPFAPAGAAIRENPVEKAPYQKSLDQYRKDRGGNFRKESAYFKDKSAYSVKKPAYFKGKSAYFPGASPYFKKEKDNIFSRAGDAVASLFR